MKLSRRRIQSQRWMQAWRMLALVAVLGLIVVLYRTTPDRGDFLEPVTVAADDDGVARTPAFEIVINNVRTADVVVVPPLLSGESGTPLRSTLGWVVVTVTAAGRDEPTQISGIRITTDDGKSYAASKRSDISSTDLTGVQLSPELPVRAMIAVEMPASELADAKLEVSESYFQALEAVAALPLPEAEGADTVKLADAEHLAPGPIR